MSTSAIGNLVVLQAGGPTPVVNASLASVIDESLRRRDRIGHIFGARDGVEGLVRGDFIELTHLAPADLELLKRTPGAALGSSRYKAADNDLPRIIDKLRRHDVRRLLMIGGNGTMSAAAAIARAAADANYELGVIGVPKTIDNDLHGTDRSPGFASAARYVAQSVRDLGMDVRGQPQPVSIFESMGRGAGWLAAASALAKLDGDPDSAPHLIYPPERPFVLDEFFADIDRTVGRLGWCVAVVSEGIRNADGRPVFETPESRQADAMNRPLIGDVAAHLAAVTSQALNIRCRSEKPGLCGRASMLHVAPQDLLDAEHVGRAAVRAALAGESAKMIGLLPLTSPPSPPASQLVPLEQVTIGERTIRPDWLGPGPDDLLAPPFRDYLRPLVGELVEYAVPLKDRLPTQQSHEDTK